MKASLSAILRSDSDCEIIDDTAWGTEACMLPPVVSSRVEVVLVAEQQRFWSHLIAAPYGDAELEDLTRYHYLDAHGMLPHYFGDKPCPYTAIVVAGSGSGFWGDIEAALRGIPKAEPKKDVVSTVAILLREASVRAPFGG